MSDVISKKDKYFQLIAFGYCRNIETKFKIDIPIIFKNIISKYSRKYIIIGIGVNENGEFSIGRKMKLTEWTKLVQLENITCNMSNIYANHESLMVIDDRSRLHVAGRNDYYQLGIKTGAGEYFVYNFRELKFGYYDNNDNRNIITSCGHDNGCHSFIYMVNNNSLYGNGNNYFGQLANAPKDATDSILHILKLIPRFWGFGQKLTQILCSWKFTLFLTSKNKLYFCGKLGDEYEEGIIETDKPILIDNNIFDIAIGNEYYMTLNASGLIKINNLCQDENKIMTFFNDNNKMKIKNIYCGGLHGIVMAENNKCYTFGCNKFGQCGNNNKYDTYDENLIDPYLIELKNNDEFVVKISCGWYHNLLLTNKNNVYSFGNNEHNQCTISVTDECILSPYLLDKRKELKLYYDNYIYMPCNVLAFHHNSTIFVDPCNKKKID